MSLDAAKDLDIFLKHLLDQEEALGKDENCRDDFLPDHKKNCKTLDMLIKRMLDEEESIEDLS